MIAVDFDSFETNKKVIDELLNSSPAVFTDWFLFAPQSLRIVPPLIISEKEIKAACQKIISALKSI